MNVLFVYAHDDPASFGAAMHNRALSFFEQKGHKAVISDLYASGFHAVAAKWDFKSLGGAHRNYMLEQSSAVNNDGAFAEDIKSEIVKIRSADIVVFEFPLWWSSTPAVLKGWFDKVFAMGVAWDGDHRYKAGLLTGKKAMVITSAGDREQDYSPTGMHGATIIQHLYPLLHSTLAHAGFDVYRPFITTGLTTSNEEDRQKHIDKLGEYLERNEASPDFIYKH
ncbi:NAD(P)H-dependent oxidoreductase [Candidatus Saccharibacteria bacterium]|jgi:NAD(P)H dehydrogenase (quinone)|nr:NAD(P)H-dependent oxidoreductase [Candidatus Saccharibacteria bacterium]